MGKAFHFGEKIYATVSCPIRSSQACLIAAEARRFGVRLSGKVEVRLARGVRARVALPILPGRALEVLRLSERGGRSLIIRTAIEGEGMPSERTVEFRQR
jgi:hypothetical protein